jgi:predicted ATPase/DNA-binding SARP family transcriptional activator
MAAGNASHTPVILSIGRQANVGKGLAFVEQAAMPLAVWLMGRMRFAFEGKPIRLTGPEPMLGLFAALVLARGHPVARAALAQRLWPRSGSGDPLYELRQQVYNLKNAIARLGSDFEPLVTTKSSLALRSDAVAWLDIDEYERLVAQRRWEEASQLYAPLLDEAWAQEDPELARERERLAALQTRTLEHLIAQKLDAANLNEVFYNVCELVRLDPERQEVVPDVLRRARALIGRAGSLRLCRRFLDFLVSLDDEPLPELNEAYRALLGSVPHQPPAPLRSRLRDVAGITSMLDLARCVTIAGPPGIGKTRLALHLAHELAARFDDGVWFVDLSNVPQADLVEPAILGVMNPLAPAGATPLDELFNARRLLLVLDACERTISRCASLVDRLLATHADLRVLATSRAPLGAQHERIWRLEPLELSAAMDFFSARLRALRPQAAASDPASIASICRRLDGVPLLLELAAARARGMSPHELAMRLEIGLDVLAGSTAGGSSLAATFAWSYRLLSPAEQRVFRRIGIFPSTFTSADAAELDGEASPREIAQALAKLVDLSLLERLDENGEAAFVLLRPLRDFAQQMLSQEQEFRTLAERFAALTHRFVTERADAMAGPAPQIAFEEIARRWADVRATLGFFFHDNDVTAGLDIAFGLTRYWFDRGGSEEGAFWLRTALEKVGSDSYLRGRALYGLYIVTRNLGDFQAAYELAAQALDATRETQEAQRTFFACIYTANALRMIGRFDEAQELASEALDRVKDSDVYLSAFAEATLGTVALCADRLSEARTRLDRAISGFRACGATGDTALALANLGACALAEGETETADILVQDALRCYREAANPPYYVAHACELSIKIALARNDLGGARRFARELVSFVETLGDIELAIVSAECLAQVAAAAGDPAGAAALLAACASLRARYHAPRFAVESVALDATASRARRELGERAYEAARIVGTGFDLAATIACARDIAFRPDSRRVRY